MRSLAIIPARGGSKRLPRKNVMDFLGRPIIAYTIEAALASGCFSRVVVSTDDAEIADISARYHSDVVIRPAELATDEARVVDVCEHFLHEAVERGECYDVLSVLYATAPLRSADDVRTVLDFVTSGRHHSAIAATTYSLPVHQALVQSKSSVEQVFPDLFSRRSNEVPEYFVDNGSTYAVTTDYFLRERRFISPDLAIHLMPRARSVDVDTWEDYVVAKCFAELIGAEK